MRRFASTIILAGLLLGAAPLRAAPDLAVCLEKNSAPYSFKHGAAAGGFDLAVAAAVAKRLGRTLTVQWFTIPAQPDTDKPPPSTVEDALLSDGKCQLIGGFPLSVNALAKPPVATSRLPAFDGARPADRGRRVALGALAASRAYEFVPFAVLLGPKAPDRPIHSLADLRGMTIGTEKGTLADAILMLTDQRRLVPEIVHVAPGLPSDRGGGLLERLDRGDYQATLVELHRFDVYRKDHPQTKIRPSGYYHEIGFNMGFAGLASEAALIGEVDTAIAALLAANEIAPLAAAQGMTYVPPRQPEVRGAITLGELARD